MKLCSTQELDIIKTFECGQCFRWNCGDDRFTGALLPDAMPKLR